MIRYLYSKVNLWKEKYWFSMKENKVIEGQKLGTGPIFSKKWGQAPLSPEKEGVERKGTIFFFQENGACPL